MTCERCQVELEDFLYGEVSGTRAGEIKEHLVACAACATVRAELERERELFAQFYERTALEPTPEMWEAVRSRIRAEPAPQPLNETREGWFGGLTGGWALAWLLKPVVLRQAAFAVVLIALSVAVTTLLLKRNAKDGDDFARGGGNVAASPTPQTGLTPTPAPANELAGPGAQREETNSGQPAAPPPLRRMAPPARRLTDQELLNQQLARAEREYQNAIRMLDRAIVRRKDNLDPEIFKQYEGSLALIDNSIAESRRALRGRPNDLAAGQFLLAAYARKVELMQDIAMR
jgi:hypothetical protein